MTLFSGRTFYVSREKNFRFSKAGEASFSSGIDEHGIDDTIDSDLRVILRKLTKKDSTTKIRVKNKIQIFYSQYHSCPSKAFNELRDYCDANEKDDQIQAILPFFVSHYRKWSIVS